MPARSTITTLPITAPAMRPGDQPVDGVGETDGKEAEEAFGPIEPCELV
jgi:hypothetical protein